MRNKRLTPAELHNHLVYHPDTGALLRKNTSKPVYVHDGSITILDRRYLVRSVVWAMISGEYPQRYQVRCVDGDPGNLKADNFKLIPPGHKYCRLCKNTLPLIEFNKDKSGGGGVGNECKACLKLRPQSYRQQERKSRLKRKYNFSQESFDHLAALQGNACAICRDPKHKLVVDHCHTNNLVRGLLCSKCNAAIGLLKDSPELLQSAIDYLKKSAPNF